MEDTQIITLSGDTFSPSVREIKYNGVDCLVRNSKYIAENREWEVEISPKSRRIYS